MSRHHPLHAAWRASVAIPPLLAPVADQARAAIRQQLARGVPLRRPAAVPTTTAPAPRQPAQPASTQALIQAARARYARLRAARVGTTGAKA